MIKAITINGSVKIGVPKFWVMSDGTHDFAFDKRSDEVHFSEGYKEVVTPVFNPETQRLGAIFERENDFTYPIIDKSEEEIRNEIKSQVQSQAEEVMQRKLRDDVIGYFQTVSEEDALQNQAIFPFWEPDLEWVEPPLKYQDWLGLKMVLWECIQPHAPSNYAFRPADLPALWKRVALPDEILPWVQPLGAHDSYQVGDQVTHNGKLWLCASPNNVWEPGVFGWTDLGAYP